MRRAPTCPRLPVRRAAVGCPAIKDRRYAALRTIRAVCAPVRVTITLMHLWAYISYRPSRTERRLDRMRSGRVRFTRRTPMRTLIAVLGATLIGTVAFAQDTTVIKKEGMG